jgi:nucleoside-diphosphate-sugar epimerase
VVAVSFAGSTVGRAVVAHLVDRVGRPAGPSRVVAVDVATRLADLPDAAGGAVDRREADPASAQVAAALRGVDVVVHSAAPTDLAADLLLTATARRARAVRAVQEVAAGAAATGAARLVVITSAMVLGARAGNPVPLPDDAPSAAERDDGVVTDLLEVERIVERLPRVHPGLRTSVLRPAALVGAGVDTLVTRHFRSPRLLAVRGEAMSWQFCHVDDLAAAVGVTLAADLDGVLPVGCLSWLSSREVERITGMRRIELPAGIAFATAQRLHRAGAIATPPAELAYVVHPWVVRPTRLLDAGWTPRHDAAACAALVATAPAGEDSSRPREQRRDAALGAAGAAVAVLGTAALLRQARGRRSGRRRPTL